MPTALDSYTEYSRLVFSLLTDCATVERHPLAVYTTSRTIGITRGQIVFRSGHVLRVFKHHRIPATGLSFTEANLPPLIAEIEALIAGSGPHDQ